MSNFNEEICVETEDFKESEDLASVTIVRSNTVKLDSGIGKVVKYKVNEVAKDFSYGSFADEMNRTLRDE